MESKVLKNELNLGESGFYFIKMQYANEYVPFHRFEVVQVDEEDYITEMTYGREWKGSPEIIYTTHKGLHLSNTEIFKTEEQALQHAKELNEARIYNALTDLMEMTNILTEHELLDLEDRFVGFLMEIKARFNAFTKTQYPTEGEE